MKFINPVDTYCTTFNLDLNIYYSSEVIRDYGNIPLIKFERIIHKSTGATIIHVRSLLGFAFNSIVIGLATDMCVPDLRQSCEHDLIILLKRFKAQTSYGIRKEN